MDELSANQVNVKVVSTDIYGHIGEIHLIQKETRTLFSHLAATLSNDMPSKGQKVQQAECASENRQPVKPTVLN